MNPTQLAMWGQRYSLSITEVMKLQRLIRKRVQQQEHACNGDPHPSVRNREDKNANSQAWTMDSDKTDTQLEAFALSLGFTRVDFGVGLYPALEKGDETCIMVP